MYIHSCNLYMYTIFTVYVRMHVFYTFFISKRKPDIHICETCILVCVYIYIYTHFPCVDLTTKGCDILCNPCVYAKYVYIYMYAYRYIDIYI